MLCFSSESGGDRQTLATLLLLPLLLLHALPQPSAARPAIGRLPGAGGEAGPPANEFPVIGLLLQETDSSTAAYGRYYVPASYARFVEQAGARALAVPVGQTDEYYENLVRNINGILLPGGDVDLTTSLFAQAAKTIYRLAREANDRGEPFVMWGTCQGHEEMSTFPTGVNLMSNCTGTENVSLPIDLTSDWYDSRLLSSLPTGVLRSLATQPIAFHVHYYCLSMKTYSQTEPLREFFRVAATNTDRAGMQFVSVMEARDYPFYSVQFHPEKNNYNWQENMAISHSADAVLVSQAMANFLISEARRGPQRLTNETFVRQLIDWFPLTFDGTLPYYFFK